MFETSARWEDLRSDAIAAGLVIMLVGSVGALSSGFRWRKSLTPVLRPVFRISGAFAALGALVTAGAWLL